MFPNKRIKLDLEQEQRNAIIISEIDVELGLRKRLAQTLEQRIAWASLLLESLQNETEYNSELSFKDVALDALSSIDSQSDILFTREVDVPPANVTHKGRLPPKEKPITRSQKSKFMYLRSQDSPQIFLLRCPTCQRSSFSSLQGLYNHARITHLIEWGSHEECVKACAVPQQDLDADLDLEAGIDAGGGMGVLPGVRSLFQMAVDGSRDEQPQQSSGLEADETETRSIHLTKTLGLHSDSPALAQFLGKEAKRKGIKVWDDGQPIDIYSLDDEPHAKRPRWRKSPFHRNKPRSEEEIAVKEIESRMRDASTSSGLITSATNPTVSSRFHISCRVILADSSLYIPEEQRTPEIKDHTHQWMISVESASYSIDLTTVLTSLTVTSAPSSDLNNGVSVSSPPLCASEPPFVIVGTTPEPFLAQVELMFNASTSGPGQDGQKVVLEHWVGLDMIGTNKSPTKGDEQVVDVELDKDTIVKPAKTGYISVNSKAHWESMPKKAGKNQHETTPPLTTEQIAEDKVPASYTELLVSLLPQFPMTLKDTPHNSSSRTVTVTNLSYKLHAGPTQLKALVIGRRKAIEWARAKAIQAAYTDRIRVLGEEHQSCSHLVPLTTGDVFSWLEDEGHFLREMGHKPSQNDDEDELRDDITIIDNLSEGKWCRVCGLGLWAHGTEGLDYIQREADALAAAKQAEEEKPILPRLKIRLMGGKVIGGGGPSTPVAPRLPPFRCQIVPHVIQLFKMPVVEVYRIFGSRLQPEGNQPLVHPPNPTALIKLGQLPPWSARTYRLVRDNRSLISAIDPHFILGVRAFVNALRPSSIAPSHSFSKFPLAALGTDAAAVEANLAPHAMLALATKQFIRLLIQGAMGVQERDRGFGLDKLQKSNSRDVALLAPPRRSKGAGANAGKKGKEKEKIKVQSVKVLTPMHVIMGVMSNYVRATALASVGPEGKQSSIAGDVNGNVAIAMFGCLSRIGRGIEEKNDPSA